jgi:hypothetical protein
MKATAEEYATIAAQDKATATLATARAATTTVPAVTAIVATAAAEKQKPQL